jgi:nucleotide-binding universal stress UspA family protein
MPHSRRWPRILIAMPPTIIVSYDGTSNDDDALVLGKMLAAAGAELELAYVRHSQEFDPRREELAQHDAERRLEQGAQLLGDTTVARHVVVSASTGAGLARLAESEGASVIVFGSDYRITPGRVEPGTTAQFLLEGGPVAIAVAPAGLRLSGEKGIRAIAVAGPAEDTEARQTADALAERLGADVVASGNGSADLTVVGSQIGAPPGRIALGGATRNQLDSATSAVLVLPRGVAVTF